MGKTILINAHSQGVGYGAGTTTYTPVGMGPLQAIDNTTESNAEITWHLAGTLSKLQVHVSANAASATSTVRTRKNAANGGQSVSIGAGTTGWFYDASNTDTVADNDELTYQIVVGSGGTLTIREISTQFEATTNTVQLYFATAANGNGDDDPTFRGLVGSSSPNSPSRAQMEVKFKTAGTLKKLYIRMRVNTYNTNVVWKIRINGTDSSISATVPSSTTGIFEDVSNTAAVAVDDTVCYSCDRAGTGSNFNSGCVAISFETTNGQFEFFGQVLFSHTNGTNITNYFKPAGELETGQTTESTVQSKQKMAFRASKLRAYSNPNSISAQSTLYFRKNGADGNQSVAIPASTTGFFEDASNFDDVAIDDLINYKIITGGSGSTMVLNFAAFTVSFPPTTIGITKSLQYAVALGIAITKSLQYVVVGTVAITKSLKYTVAITPSAITKALKYTVLFVPSAITKSLKYTVSITPSAITKSLQYAVNVPTAITKSLKYTVLATAAAITKSLKYTVAITPSAITKALEYRILFQTLAITKSLQYAVGTATAITKSLKYTIGTTPSAITKSLAYYVAQIFSITKSLKYVVLTTPAAITKSLTYRVLFQTTAITKSLQYVVVSPVAIQKSLKYTLFTTPAALTKSLQYEIGFLTVFTITKSLSYRVVFQSVAITKSLQYKVSPSVAITKQLKYNITGNSVIKSLSLRYVIRKYPYTRKASPYHKIPRN